MLNSWTVQDEESLNKKKKMEIDIGDTALGRLVEEKKRDAHRVVKEMSASELAELEATIARVKNQNESEPDAAQPRQDAV